MADTCALLYSEISQDAPGALVVNIEYLGATC
jgi:hypothetical protein